MEHSREMLMLIKRCLTISKRGVKGEPCVEYGPQVRAQIGLDEHRKLASGIPWGEEMGDPFVLFEAPFLDLICILIKIVHANSF